MSIFNLAWFIPLFPFIAFLVISLFINRNHILSHCVALGGIAISFVLSQIVFWSAVLLPVGGGEHAFESAAIPWFSIGQEVFSLGVYIDPAAAVMLFMVPLLCLLIFIYSLGYMHGDPRYSRFFAYISLCAAGMLGMIVFNNLLVLFICLEIMGTSAYFLISFWYEEEDAVKAGLKSFLVTKVGIVLLMLGMIILYSEVGSLAYRDIFKPETLEHLAHTPFMGTQWSLATVIALLLFGGTVGKSAQIPLHVWLPDAMVAPTPASALIHAATVDSAGIFLVMRIFPIFTAVEGGPQMTVMAAIGAFTAILMSFIAIAQNDIKRVLAFSTISQLGYMVAAFGIGAYVAGAFHMITHAFFKALLFLGLGSVTHSMEHGYRLAHGHFELEIDGVEGFDSHDMLSMGGLVKRIPHNFWVFLIGGLALSGFPLITAGFWSKHEILEQAYLLSPAVFWVLVVAAGLTSFYTMRQICLTFLGHPRTMAAEHAQKSPSSIAVPLTILAVFSISLGWVGVPETFPVIGGLIPNWFHNFIGPMIEVENASKVVGLLAEASHGSLWQPLAVSLVFKLGGLGLGWLVYGLKPMQVGELDRMAAALHSIRLGWLYDAMRDRFYFDEIYRVIFERSTILISDLFHTFDFKAIDGVVHVSSRLGLIISRISDWFDTNVVDGEVKMTGRLGQMLSRISDWLDTNVVDGNVDKDSRTGNVTSRLDLDIVDPSVSLITVGVRLLSALSDVVDLKVVDGVVNRVGVIISAAGRLLQPFQTGRVQNYLLLAFLAVLVVFAINSL